MDTGVMLESKLRAEWSAPEFAQIVTSENLSYASNLLEHASSEFQTFEVGIKLRLLLSFLSLPVPRLQALWNDIEKVLEAASSDTEEWVRVVLDMVKRRLPSQADIGVSAGPSPALSAAIAQEPAEAVALAAARAAGGSSVLANPEEDFFAQAVREVASRLISNSGGQEHTRKEILSPELVPFEWPYLCSQVLPPMIEIENSNRHFSLIVTPGVVGSLSVSDNLSAKRKERESSFQPSSPPAGSPLPGGSPAASSLAPVGSPLPADTQIPDSVVGLLKDPSNEKLDNEGRAVIYEFYSTNRKPDRPTSGTVLVLLSEMREYVDDNAALSVTQTQLKLDYSDNTAKRVKMKKKYKIKDGGALS